MYGAAAWRGTASELGAVRCAMDGVGSARQAFWSASAFNQNIGSWNTAAVTTMSNVRALALSHACGAQPTSLLAAVVPGADVGMAHLGCGRVAVQMWASPGAGSWPRCGSTVSEPGVFYL
jgi:surface protein